MKRRRSPQVAAPLLAATALALLTGCKHKELQRCVDETGKVVADNLCQAQPGQPAPANQTSTGHPVIMPIYRWYYGGGGGYSLGSTVSGGGYVPVPGHSYSVSRGGFGSTFSGHSFGE